MNKQVGYIYIHKKKSNNEPFYVGLGGFAKSEPLKSYKRAYKMTQRNHHHKKIVEKHGVIVEIYKENLTFNEAKSLECQLIQQYNLFKIGANRTLGGEGTLGYAHTKETKKITSETTNSRFSDPSWKAKWLESLNKKDQVTIGSKISNTLKGKFKGEKNPFYGKTHSTSIKKLLSEKAKIQCKGSGNPRYKGLCVTPMGFFKDAKEASNILNIAYSTIVGRCNKNSKYKNWYYQKDQING